MRLILSASLILLLCQAAIAQKPQLVQDIQPGPSPKQSLPTSITYFGDRILFAAIDSMGQELWEWRATGTPAKRLTDNGLTGSYSGCLTNARTPRMPVMNGDAYFGTYLSTSTIRLLKYKPTGAIDTVGDARGLDYSSMSAIGNKICYFVGDTSAGASSLDQYLNIYDGANPPVRYGRKFRNVNNGSGVFHSMAYNGKYYFGADTAGYGIELLAFDPATNSISLVADIYSGGGLAKSSQPGTFAVIGSKLYFTATDSAHGEELYSYDGATVKRLTDIVAGPSDGVNIGSAGTLALHKGGIFFSGISNPSTLHSALFRYDTASGVATKVYDPFPSENSYPSDFLSTPNNLFFAVTSSLNTGTGTELHRFDGKTYSMVADLNPGSKAGVNSNLELFGGYVYFAGDDGTTGYELYRVKDSASANAVVEQVQWHDQLQVFPNPARDGHFTISLDAAGHAEIVCLTVTNMTGQQVMARQYEHTGRHFATEIDISTAAKGIYFLRIEADGEVISRRVVIQ